MKANLDSYLRSVVLLRDKVKDFSRYPFSIPAVRNLEELALHPKVTFFVGENGSGKSTLVEALAVASGFNAEGGSRHFNFATRRSESELHKVLRLVRGVKRPKTGYFLRAESLFNVGTTIEELDKIPGAGPLLTPTYGGKSLHEQSHGESFLALLNNRFGPNGLYLLDEPEAALSPQRQLAMLQVIDGLVRGGNSQMVIATHSPILLAYPYAQIYSMDEKGMTEVKLEETEHFALTRDFLGNPQRYLKRLLADND